MNGKLSSDNRTHSHIAFDLDGVLIDSLALMEESWQYAKANLQKEVKHTFNDYAKHIGKPFLAILEIIGIPDQYHEEIQDRYERYASDNCERVKIFEVLLTY